MPLTKTPGKPNPIDVYIGSRIRLRRTLLGLSQEALAKPLGLTFQQIQKYERGANRVGGSRMFVLAQVLKVPPQFFFDDMPPEIVQGEAPPTGTVDDPIARRETLELVRAYYRIDTAPRRKVFDLVKALGRTGPVPKPAAQPVPEAQPEQAPMAAE